MKINKKIEVNRFIGTPPKILRFMTSNLVFRERSHHTFNQFLRVMKLTIFILTVCLIHVSALTKAQITLNESKASLRTILKSISKQSGFDFVYNDKDLDKASPISIKVNDVSVELALRTAFEGQPLIYEIADKTVMVKRRDNKSYLETVLARLQTIDVRGRVIDSLGNALQGASVKVKNGKGATTTNANGDFYLQKVDENAVLVFTYIGYQSREISVSANLGNVVLRISDSKLDEVQVIAYGTVQKKFSTGNIGSIKAEDINKQPVSNLLLALQARVPGLYIQQNSGNTTGNVKVAIQGKNSLANGNDPFYVVDGVPYPNNNNSGLDGGIIGGGGNSTLNFLNPADIESVEVLKDADATAIYGSRAANGAILITTKKGKPGETKVDLNMQSGWGKITRTYDLLNTQQYVALRKEAIQNGGNIISSTDYDINGVWDQSRNVNWQKELAGGTAHYTNLNVSISGGNENTQFRAGAGYIRQTTVYPGNFADNKNNVQLSINHHSTNRKFRFSLSGNYLQDLNQINTGDLFQVAITLAPDAPEVFNPDGSINWSPLPTNPNVYTFDNPARIFLMKYRAETNNLIANSNIGYEILPGLELKTSLGYNRLEANANTFIPITFWKPDSFYKARSARFATNSIASWIAEPQLTYNHQYNFGHVETLLGGTFQQSKTDLLNQDASGFNNDAQLENIGAASTVTIGSTVQSLYRYSAIFARINYRLKDRYILNLSARRDGSSRFGSANLFNSFYSAAAAWIFTEEPIMKFAKNILSFGKIRASYGTSGNDQIGDYAFLSLYNNQNYQINYQNTTGLTASGISNPYLQWEETRKLDVGIDMGFLNNRILLNANYFRNRSSNQLVNSPVPTTTGFTYIRQNLPATVQNTGVELSLDATLYKARDFNWQISANLTLPRNKLIAFPNIENSGYADVFVVGEPITIWKAYKFEGLNTQTGFYQFRGANGQLTSNPDFTKDRIQLINTSEKWYGGISNSFTYKGLELSFLLQIVKSIRANYRFGPYFPGFANINLPANFIDRWQKKGDNALNQQVQTSYDFISPFVAATGSDAAYSDATFMRLKNASLSYTIPSNWLHRIHITNARAYVQGQNLFTISNYIGDPETGYGTLPPLRIFSLGIQLTF